MKNHGITSKYTHLRGIVNGSLVMDTGIPRQFHSSNFVLIQSELCINKYLTVDSDDVPVMEL